MHSAKKNGCHPFFSFFHSLPWYMHLIYFILSLSCKYFAKCVLSIYHNKIFQLKIVTTFFKFGVSLYIFIDPHYYGFVIPQFFICLRTRVLHLHDNCSSSSILYPWLQVRHVQSVEHFEQWAGHPGTKKHAHEW